MVSNYHMPYVCTVPFALAAPLLVCPSSAARDYILGGLLELLNSVLVSHPLARATAGDPSGGNLVAYILHDVLFHKHRSPGQSAATVSLFLLCGVSLSLMNCTPR